MMKKIITILAGCGVFILLNVQAKENVASTARAYGELIVDFGVAANQPIFTVNNMAPGASETRNIQVRNSGNTAKYLAIKGVRVGPEGQGGILLEELMQLTIGGDANYGSGKTMQNFFQESVDDGIGLGVIGPGQTKNYTVTGILPATVENEGQGKTVVFDITFGTVAADHLVINEVLYHVDSAHGADGEAGKKNKGQNHEWIELYNPTANEVSLKNWSLEVGGKNYKINANKRINAGRFALLSKDASGWKYWNEDSKAEKIEMGQFPELSNSGGEIGLKNPAGQEIDLVKWNTDGWIGGGAGQSIVRIAPGYDQDQPTDWEMRQVPIPGN